MNCVNQYADIKLQWSDMQCDKCIKDILFLSFRVTCLLPKQNNRLFFNNPTIFLETAWLNLMLSRRRGKRSPEITLGRWKTTIFPYCDDTTRQRLFAVESNLHRRGKQHINTPLRRMISFFFRNKRLQTNSAVGESKKKTQTKYPIPWNVMVRGEIRQARRTANPNSRKKTCSFEIFQIGFSCLMRANNSY